MYTHVREFVPFLEANCPEADNALLRLTVILTALDFCKKSHIHQETMPTLDLEAGEPTYQIVLPPYCDLAGIRAVYINGNEIEAKSPDSLNREMPGWKNMESDPIWYHQDEPKTVRLIPAPREPAAGALSIRVALQPSPKSQHVWDRLYTDYFNEILAGALSKLLAMPKKPWTDKQSALENKYTYLEGLREAKTQAIKQFTNESIYVQPRTLA